MNVPSVAFVAAFLLSAVSLDTKANEVGFYVGGALGQAKKDADRAEFELLAQDVHDFFGYTPLMGQPSYDDSDTSYSLMIGYRLNRYLAFEGGYTHLGELSYKSLTTGNYPNDAGSLNMRASSETSGFTLSALGVVPITYNWEVYARGGVLFATNEVSLDVDTIGEVFVHQDIAASFSESTDELYAGVGVSLRFLDIYDVRLEYQRVFDAGLLQTLNEGDLDVATLGLTVTF
jgi:opacity protein-like surface antigen